MRYLKIQALELKQNLPRVGMIVIPIVLAFWLLDLAVMPEAASATLTIRLLWCLLLLISIVLARRTEAFLPLEIAGLIGIVGGIAASVSLDVVLDNTERMVLRVILTLIVGTLLTARYYAMLIVIGAAILLPNLALLLDAAEIDSFVLINAYLLAAVALYATVCSSRIAHLGRVAELEVALTAQQQESDRLSRLDPLTGLWNRRHFLELAERELARARRRHSETSLLMADIDHFKAVNDSFGHPGGDEVLRRYAALWGGLIRKNDLLARIGGEEFALLLPDTDRSKALEIAERLRQATAATEVAFQDETIRATLSLGGVGIREGESLDQALARADEELYRAKAEGRNCVRMERQDSGDRP